MNTDTTYDVAIVGGGLAGLALSIQLARWGHRVIVFEKEQYPFHRVCGEYISFESWDFLKGLGVDLENMNLPVIQQLLVTGMNGRSLHQTLPLGGFGISRYKLDHTLAVIARSAGVVLAENTKVNEVAFKENGFHIQTSAGDWYAKVSCACFGKRSNLDIKWKRPFSTAAKNKLNNYIGVKYHARSNFPADTIALHLFKNGYCGVVRIEDGTYNLCYLTTAVNLQQSHNSIPEMEANILGQNPELNSLLKEIKKCSEEPVTISQVSFDRKNQVEDHTLMIGDAAGMITPLCGNGMSMALHGSKIAAGLVHAFLQDKISRDSMEKQYALQWQRQFASRLRTGRRIQRIFGRAWLTNILIGLGSIFPGIITRLIRHTHGRPF